MPKTRIAVPITAPTVLQALKGITEVNALADVIELRLDFLKVPKLKDVQALVKACKKPVICTCRPKREGGKFTGSEEERTAVLCSAIEAGVGFVDVELGSCVGPTEGVARLAREKGIKVILSAHFTDRTPNRAELDNLFNDMAMQKPYAIKIVGTALCDKDNDTMLGFLKQHNRKGTRLIAFCMGRKGMRSRIESAKHGAFLAFASLGKGKGSAEGQLGVKAMRKLISG